MAAELKPIDLYYLIQWAEVIPYITFSSVSATRQKVAMKLAQADLLTLEPFLTITDKGMELVTATLKFANRTANNG